MIRIDSQQLNGQIYNKLNNSYLLIGNEPLLIDESYDLINIAAKINGFQEHVNIAIDSNTNWINLFTICNSLSLFNYKKVINLQFTENCFNLLTIRKMKILHSLLSPDILLICRIKKLTKSVENSIWFREFFQSSVIISCWQLSENQLIKWILKRVENMNLIIDESAIKLLCCYYEGNLSALSQSLKFLHLQCPDSKITTSIVTESLSEAPFFSAISWVNTLLEGNIIRAINILKQLSSNDSDAIILFNTLQRDMLILVKLYHYQQQKSIRIIMDEYKIWKTRHSLFKIALKRLDSAHLQSILYQLIAIELSIKQNQYPIVWLQLELLSFIICKSIIIPADLSYVF
ncbi:DNA polymerase III subunit delta [Candidatus Pantoea edessiphila]|uniref:DNA polymerase III subunit delta n=1 Tax=Candidatus Pantoea edessiphila TaxID=2044610 RepID=A0A2P5T0C2_9GAMM|nr:DNA polymerase III subunit delta [Candidatus Pantoea edessiphila]PPI88044.1 DNA polymerase III subunit delta [Candidatus Pantoea edessiphila]